MALKTFVKVGNITNLSDARYCAGMGVDMLSFPIANELDNKISSEEFADITTWVSGPKFIGEFGMASLEEIKSALLDYNLDGIETHDLDLVEPIQLLGKEIVFKLEINQEQDVTKIKSKLSYLDELAKMVVLVCEKADLFPLVDDQILYYGGNLQLVKGYDVSSQKIKELTAFRGLEIMGSPEERPGFKDFGDVMDLLELLEDDH